MSKRKTNTGTWRKAQEELKTREAQPPAGWSTLDEIAEEIESTKDVARDLVNKLVKEGRAERMNGKQMNAVGALINCHWYRLI